MKLKNILTTIFGKKNAPVIDQLALQNAEQSINSVSDACEEYSRNVKTIKNYNLAKHVIDTLGNAIKNLEKAVSDDEEKKYYQKAYNALQTPSRREISKYSNPEMSELLHRFDASLSELPGDLFFGGVEKEKPRLGSEEYTQQLIKLKNIYSEIRFDFVYGSVYNKSPESERVKKILIENGHDEDKLNESYLFS